MVSSLALVGSKVSPFGVISPNANAFSFRHFHRRVEGKFPVKNLRNDMCFRLSKTHICSPLLLQKPSKSFSSLALDCTGSHSNTKIDTENRFLKSLKNISLESIKSRFSQLTPFDVCKWSLLFSLAIAASNWTVGVLISPFFWMYFSLSLVFWPWMVAIGLAIYGLYCLKKHSCGEANKFEQIAIVTSAFTWLTLVPPAHFNGYLEGWPLVFFFVYHYFFFLNVSVRKRLYGDLLPRKHDNKWDISLPNRQTLLFSLSVLVGHWLAAFEGPELNLITGGRWINAGIWALIMMTIFMQYHSTLYLANYSEKVVVPTAVVQFGPYRFVRHPIYASTMLLFATFCITLRAPFSTLFVVAVCLVYYGEKAKLEEALMVETFGERYLEYARKVQYRLLPFVY
ncbi:unnamed protein product [Cuscuta europaea]|uniref:Protein-S-isoprenylcysteine O-methyltransferase n=1 Tax=Cuscuta europaea TaxID=41803 RepID=A0A9P0YRD2_CUSEU|nr:unnamed protein product [Cuscuta europaea]